VLAVLFGLFNLFNFLYQLYMARSLSLSDFSALKTIFFFLYLGGILMETIQTIVTKYIAQEPDRGRHKGFLTLYHKRILPYAAATFLIMAIVAIPLSSMLSIQYGILLAEGIFIVGSMLVPVTRGILQGEKRFFSFGFSVLLEGIIKLFLALILVKQGFGLYGAVIAVIAAIFISYIGTLLFLRWSLKEESKPAKLPGIRQYSLPVLFVTGTVIAFFNIDVLIARLVFTPETAGIYAIISTIAVVIYMGSQPIIKALFPITAEKQDSKPASSNLKKAIALFTIGVLVALSLVYFFPELLIKTFSKQVFPEAIIPLFILALGLSLLSFTNILLMYALSRGKTKGFKLIPLMLVIEIVCLLIGKKSLFSFSLAFLTATIIFLWASLVLLTDETSHNNTSLQRRKTHRQNA